MSGETRVRVCPHCGAENPASPIVTMCRECQGPLGEAPTSAGPLPMGPPVLPPPPVPPRVPQPPRPPLPPVTPEPQPRPEAVLPPPAPGAPAPPTEGWRAPTGSVPPPPPYVAPPPPPLLADQYENTSGQGPTAALPAELQGWNWGGFLLNWIWAVVHKAWLGFFLSFFCGIVGQIVCGLKGNEWAWQNNRYDSFDHFREVQRKWAVWGAVVWVAYLVLMLGSVGISLLSSVVGGGSGSGPTP